MAQDQQVPQQDDQARDGTENVNPRQFNQDLAKAFEELSKGERAASALENRLSGIEGRIEQLLASVEEQAREQGGPASQAEGKTPENTASK